MGFESSDKYKQNDTGHIYIAIDLKSFYASVECVERGLDPLTTNLVVADESRTEKTICLAVSPSLKAYGISGRARLFEVVQKANEIKAATGKKIDYIVAKPRMAYYMEYSTKIYNIYLRYIAPEDIHVYSVDEVFIDVTSYLKTYEKTPRELAMMLIMDVLKETGITATAGIGTNLYLCKVAMDIVAKHIKPDKDGVRIAELNEISYRRILWGHKPITDFWRVGRGYAKRLASFTSDDRYPTSMSPGSPSEISASTCTTQPSIPQTAALNDSLYIIFPPCTVNPRKSYSYTNRIFLI